MGHQALDQSSSQLSVWKNRISFFTLERQPCVLNIPGFFVDLWVQGPSCYTPSTIPLIFLYYLSTTNCLSSWCLPCQCCKAGGCVGWVGWGVQCLLLHLHHIPEGLWGHLGCLLTFPHSMVIVHAASLVSYAATWCGPGHLSCPLPAWVSTCADPAALGRHLSAIPHWLYYQNYTISNFLT